MKRTILIISMLCFAMSFMAQEVQDVQEVQGVQEQNELKGAHPWRNEENENGIIEDYTHWSIAPMIGLNVFDGDFSSERRHAVGFPSLGFFFDYSFTPVWGINVEYMWSHYTVKGKTSPRNAHTLLRGDMHKLGLGLNMDIISLFFPLWNRKLFCGFPSLGAGYMWYKNTTMYPDASRLHTAEYINSKGENGPESMDKYKGTFYIQMGVAFEVNINRTFGVGARATYSYFMNDYTDNRGYSTAAALASKNNDGLFDVVAYMRIKFNPLKKTHTRNVYSFDSWKKNKKQQVEGMCHDTVIIRHDSIIVRETYEHITTTTAAAVERENMQYYYVYFDNAKYNLDNRALVTIQQVADRLEEDSTLYAVAIGYCDNTGSDATNYILGDKRAWRVVDELQEEHGIDESHLFGAGLGKVKGNRSQGSYAPNRRASIRLVDKETFEQLKEELEGKRESRLIDVEEEDYEQQRASVRTNSYSSSVERTVPLAESARPEKVNVYKERTGESVTADESTTLAKLARQYYNNTYCWVYIFIANMDKLRNPNSVKAGMELTIPELTKAEMRITKDEGLVLYNNARQGR